MLVRFRPGAPIAAENKQKIRYLVCLKMALYTLDYFGVRDTILIRYLVPRRALAVCTADEMHAGRLFASGANRAG